MHNTVSYGEMDDKVERDVKIKKKKNKRKKEKEKKHQILNSF